MPYPETHHASESRRHATTGARRGLMLLVALLGLLGSSAGPVQAGVKVGDVFPAITSFDVVPLGGPELPALGGNVVLVDFWASWCGPCKASFPTMAKLHQEFGARGLVIAAVGLDEKPAAAAGFARKLAAPFSTLHDRQQKLVREVQPPAMPTSYLIGRDGRVRYVHQGYQGEVTERTLRQQIEALLAEKS